MLNFGGAINPYHLSFLQLTIALSSRGSREDYLISLKLGMKLCFLYSLMIIRWIQKFKRANPLE